MIEMARTRLKGKGITFTYGLVEYQCDLTSVVLEKASAPDNSSVDGTVTFCDVDAGADSGNIWQMNITAVQSTDNSPEKSLHMLIWDLAGSLGGGELDFVFAPHGNADPTVEQPHFTGTVVVDAGAYPSLGGEAGSDSWTFDYTFVVKDDVVNRVGDSGPFTAKADK